eukprot:2641821-Rhodomonas_salina.2
MGTPGNSRIAARADAGRFQQATSSFAGNNQVAGDDVVVEIGAFCPVLTFMATGLCRWAHSYIGMLWRHAGCSLSLALISMRRDAAYVFGHFHCNSLLTRSNCVKSRGPPTVE